MSDLILRSWNNKNIRHRADGFMSLTDMCQAGGKQFGGWMRLDSTKEYLQVLSEKYYADLHSTPLEVNEGGGTKASGTWGDRRVAIRLAQWISPQFALQVDEWVEELMSTGSVSITPELLPVPDYQVAFEVAEFVEKMQGDFKVKNPRIAQLLIDKAMLSIVPSGTVLAFGLPSKRGVVEIAEQLGFVVPPNQSSVLGKTVHAAWKARHGEVAEEEERICNGRFTKLKVYPENDALVLAAINNFFNKNNLKGAA